MNKFIKVFVVMLMVLGIAGCNSTKDEVDNNITVSRRYEIDDVFSNYDSKEPVLMFTGESIKLSDYIKETELSYSYVLKGSDDTLLSSDDAKITDTITLDNKGTYVLSISVNDRDDLAMTSYFQVDSLEDVLANLDKNEDINALLEKYGASLSSDIDTSKPGVYSVEVKRNDDTVEYATAVVTKDEIDSNVVTESKPAVSVKEDASKVSSSSSLDKSDERIALAYDYEGRGGLCGQIAYNYLEDLGYLNNFTYEDFLMYQVLDKFEHISDPVPFKTLIEYDNGNHVAVYLGNNMALHGNYTGDYASGNGKAKIASMYISGMSITSYKNMDVTNNATQEELVKEAIGGSENADNQQSESPTNGKYKDPTLTKEEVFARPLEEDLKDFNNRFYIYEKYGYKPDMCGDMNDSEWIGELLTLSDTTMPLLDSYCNWAIIGVDLWE